MSTPSDLINHLGIQSYCFRNFKDNAQVAQLLKDCGVSAIEICGVHADFSDPAGFQSVIDLYRDAGVEIVSIGVETFQNNPAEEARFECARAAGAKFISANFMPDSSPESWRQAEKLAEKYDLRLAIHNHGGYHWLGSLQMLTHVLNNTSERIGLCLDTAWSLQAAVDPLKMAETLKNRLYGLHLKDFIFDRAGKWQDVVIGEGNLDLAGLFRIVKDANFDGYCVIEYEGDVNEPVPALTRCVEAALKTWNS